ncbi:MAG: HAD family hydrolase [Phycisphaerales bacterium]|nr:HAD family hydrolase [Phycisphaerales bacterium]
MWSGPRNISTAMMRSWEARGDCAVSDEPLYAHYLQARPEVNHPGREEILGRCETDWRRVIGALTGPIPGGRPIWYQKHMTHHLLPEMSRDWIWGLTNAFLIREPGEMIISLSKVMPQPRLADTGLPQQVELFEAVRARMGRVPPVVDARDVLEDPRGVLRALCAAVGVPFTERMLCWEPGPRPTDGVWAKHWYAAVEKSTGFDRYQKRDEPVPPPLKEVLTESRAYYDTMHTHRLRA